MSDSVEYDKLNAYYIEYLQKELGPLLKEAIGDACRTGGVLWDYISQLVVSGVDTYVYGVYEPILYHRRYGGGGLGDPENVVVALTGFSFDGKTGNFNINISNTTGPGLARYGGGAIEDQVLSGSGYEFWYKDYNGKFAVPRNFYRILDRQYNSDYAGQIVINSISGQVNIVLENAIVYALQKYINEQ